MEVLKFFQCSSQIYRTSDQPVGLYPRPGKVWHEAVLQSPAWVIHFCCFSNISGVLGTVRAVPTPHSLLS